MAERVLITGGAGFIGSHLTDGLLKLGYQVRILDNLCPQVHGHTDGQMQSARQENGNRRGLRPEYLSADAELIVGDVRNPETVAQALDGVSAVFHLAAQVGVGQSMYRIRDYVDVNVTGTAVLLEELMKHRVTRLVVASSMSIYGEGMYRTAAGATIAGVARPLDQLRRAQWDLLDESGIALQPFPTPESKPASLESVYAQTKYDQERLCLVTGRAYAIPTVALRFFNVYGPRQSLSNPYTGVLAIFASRLLNDSPPLVFEDGQQRRDFVSVHDVVRACVLALEKPNIDGEVFNIGSGTSISIASVANHMRKALGKSIGADITGKYRAGDIRHCFADIGRAEKLLGYRPQVEFAAGIQELARTLKGTSARDRALEARAELDVRGLTL